MTRRGAHPVVVLEPVMVLPVMREFDRVLRAVAGKDVTVTLVGESGAGKEVMARRLHDSSPRRSGPFIPINCAAIPEALFESELFGHERGSFTGATDRGLGKVEMAGGGTLFLDEVAEMPLALQPKLLRGSSRPTGSCASAAPRSWRSTPASCSPRCGHSRPRFARAGSARIRTTRSRASCWTCRRSASAAETSPS